MAKKRNKSEGIKVKGFVADAVIGNYVTSNATMMFKLDASQVITVVGEHYSICGQPIRSVDAGFKDITLRGYYAYGKVRRGNKELHGKHLFNIDMVVTVGDKLYSTPVRYFYEDSQEVGDTECEAWLNHVYGGVDPIQPTKPQIRKVLEWVVEISNINTYKNAPRFELEKKASSYIVRKALDILENTGCVNKKDIKGVVVYSITDKGKHALGKIANK